MAAKEFDGNQIRQELEQNGVCVVPGVVDVEVCDELVCCYKRWLNQFKQEDWPRQLHSIIQHYKVGHFKATWLARLKTKPVFKALWQTDKLLTSFDGIALSPPPELGGVQYAIPDDHWFHVDQSATRSGLHAYQGALYLEETTETDYVLRVLERSHQFHREFFKKFHIAAKKSSRQDFYKLTPEEFEWYKSQGCLQRNIPVPKGGMVLWDSRTIHDNNRPEFGRPNADRWRFVVFSCMTPAIWATPEDIAKKHEAYKEMIATSHWPSRNIHFVKDFMPRHEHKIRTITRLPDVAKTNEVKLLSGILNYDFEDEHSNGPEEPKWITLEELTHSST